MIKIFLLENKDLELNSLSIKLAMESDAININHYIDDIVLMMGVDARGLLLLIVPIVLRINLKIYNIKRNHGSTVRIIIEI
jgi:hypothetical protein